MVSHRGLSEQVISSLHLCVWNVGVHTDAHSTSSDYQCWKQSHAAAVKDQVEVFL